MKRIRLAIIRLLQGEAKSTPPDVDQQLRVDHPERDA